MMFLSISESCSAVFQTCILFMLAIHLQFFSFCSYFAAKITRRFASCNIIIFSSSRTVFFRRYALLEEKEELRYFIIKIVKEARRREKHTHTHTLLPQWDRNLGEKIELNVFLALHNICFSCKPWFCSKLRLSRQKWSSIRIHQTAYSSFFPLWYFWRISMRIWSFVFSYYDGNRVLFSRSS